MTLSYWNSQFDLRSLLPDFAPYLGSMQVRSAALDIPFTTLPYGPDPRQFVEMTGTSGPILPVFIHGGYWRALTAQDHRFVLPPLVQAHGAVANLEYRLLPHVTLAEIVADAVAGLKTLAEHTGARLFVIGHSAGGHLAVMSALHLPQYVVGAVGISGLYDLTPLPWTFLGDEVGLTSADLVGQSPLEAWTAGPAIHILAAVGADETPEFHRQAQIFASTHGADTMTIPSAHHMTVLDALADPNSTLSAVIHTRIQCAPRGSSPAGP